MVEIQAATFLMGSDDSRDERPIHRVSIDGFLIDVTQVTQADYEALMGVNPAHFKGDAHRPVENVTWYDAVLYCNARSARDGLEPVYRYAAVVDGVAGDGCQGLDQLVIDYERNGYRLPVEAEFEYAWRAGTTTEHYWGDAMDGDYAWWSENAEGSTHPVAQKKPNAWGLYDLSGNVWEWCNDWFGKDYYSLSPEKFPRGLDASLTRAVRGGSWNDVKSHHLRCTARGDLVPTKRERYYGFRCVMPAR
jgi:formylglycine-generating enzyme required for sulfatase activity